MSTNGDTGIEPEHAYEGPMLSVDDIHVYYGNIAAVKGLSLTVNKGEIVTLVGTAAKDGSNHVFANSVTRGDGATVLGFGPPPEN